MWVLPENSVSVPDGRVRAARGARGWFPFQDQRVVGVQGPGDQPGGLLGRVQGIEGEHHPGHVQRCEQVGDHRALAAFVRNLALPQDHRTVVGDRGDRKHLPGRGAAAVQQFPVDRGGGSQPRRCRVGHGPRRGAALLTLGRFAPSGGDHRCRAVASDDVGGVSAGRRVEGVAVQAGQDAPEGPFAGHQVPAA